MALKKPKRSEKTKVKMHPLASRVSRETLEAIAPKMTYVPSVYHCRGPKGERVVKRFKPQTPCPRPWSKGEAEAALSRAVRAGQVSGRWIGDFPRKVWYRDGTETIYEAANEAKTPDRYHAYPVEANQVPKRLGW